MYAARTKNYMKLWVIYVEYCCVTKIIFFSDHYSSHILLINPDKHTKLTDEIEIYGQYTYKRE